MPKEKINNIQEEIGRLFKEYKIPAITHMIWDRFLPSLK